MGGGGLNMDSSCILETCECLGAVIRSEEGWMDGWVCGWMESSLTHALSPGLLLKLLPWY